MSGDGFKSLGSLGATWGINTLGKKERTSVERLKADLAEISTSANPNPQKMNTAKALAERLSFGTEELVKVAKERGYPNISVEEMKGIEKTLQSLREKVDTTRDPWNKSVRRSNSLVGDQYVKPEATGAGIMDSLRGFTK